MLSALALINAQVYYGTDCYYGRLFYIKVFNDLRKAREAVEKKCKKMGVDPKCFKDDECLGGWRSKPTYAYANMLHTEDWDEMKISETEKAEQLAASIIALDDEIGKYVAVSYSCFDGPDEPLFLGSDDDLEKVKAMAQKYVDEQYQEINKTLKKVFLLGLEKCNKKIIIFIEVNSKKEECMELVFWNMLIRKNMWGNLKKDIKRDMEK